MTNSDTCFVFCPRSGGLGDQLLDIIASMVVSDILGCPLRLQWKVNSQNNHFHGDLVYDRRLFDLSLCSNLIHLTENDPVPNSHYRLHFPNPSASSCPRQVIRFLENSNIQISLEALLAKYEGIARQIKPSQTISNYLLDIEEGTHVIGLHLRCTDKIYAYANSVFVTSDQFLQVQSDMINSVSEAIRVDKENNRRTRIFICSESPAMIDEMRGLLKNVIHDIEFLNPSDIPQHEELEYKGISAARDMFCLSQCHSIHQSVSYSTFSLLASLIGAKQLVNYCLGKTDTIQYGWILDEYPSYLDSSIWGWQSMYFTDKN